MEKEFAYYGIHACEALWHYRPEAVRKIYFHRDNREGFGAWAQEAEAHKVPVKWVEATDLERLTETVHHQGICMVAREKGALDFNAWVETFEPAESCLLLYLDNVGNPHNLGAIVRTAAHFGVPALLGEKGNLPRLTPAATRTAEGGGELVDLVRLPKSRVEALLALREKGFRILASGVETESVSLTGFVLPKLSVLILGSEQKGISDELLDLADKVITIPGTGAVQSLNVSVSAAIFMAEFARQWRPS